MCERHVVISSPPRPLSEDKLEVDPDSLEPRKDQELAAGDILRVMVKATSGCRGTFRVGEGRKEFPLREEKREGGHASASIYRGVLPIEGKEGWKEAQIRVSLKKGEDALAYTLPGKISVIPAGDLRVVRIKAETATGRTGPQGNRQFFLPEGSLLVCDGRVGDNLRLRLAPSVHAWVNQEEVTDRLPGSEPSRSPVSSVGTTVGKKKSQVIVALRTPLPHRVEQLLNPPRLRLYLYGAHLELGRIASPGDDPVISHIQCAQPQDGVTRLDIFLKQKRHWGYSVKYVKNSLYLGVRKAPEIPPRARSPLKGRVIALDPGHEPDKGAVGPTRILEKDVNLRIALLLKDMLEEEGATVIMTRKGKEPVQLKTRPEIAVKGGAEILLSIHSNALPNGSNPETANCGPSVYYYHPQSLALARSLQKELVKTLELPDHGVYWASLRLCRPTEMPAVLIEVAFLTLPEQEMLLGKRSFQEKAAQAICRGLGEFLTAGSDNE